MRNRQKSILIAAGAATFFLTAAFGQSPKGSLQEKLVAEYALTTPTADNTDIVTAGCVLTFQKRGLTASAITAKVPSSNNFRDKDPQIRPSAAAATSKTLKRIGGFGSFIPGAGAVAGAGAAAGDTRVFVNGEKIFVTKIDVDPVKDLVTFDLLSDAYNDVRYRALLRFEFAKGTLATADLPQIQPILDQAIVIAPAAADASAPAQAPAPAAPAPAAVAPPAPVAPPEPAMAPIAPPPPPPADPKSIENGMTKDQVVAIMGQPISTAKVGTKEIYTYKDLKIIFINGKMTDAQ
jgi:hypothetical protein